MNHDDFNKKVEHITDRFADKTAMVYMTEKGADVRFSFGDVYDIMIETRSVLQKCGVVCGDRAAIITPHSPFGVMAGLALAYANITAVLIDATLPVEEICGLLEFSDVRALFTTNDLYGRISGEQTQNIPCFELGRDNTIIKFIDGSIETVAVPETVDKDTDVIAIIFSSGTTDKMKGIMVPYHSVIRARDVFADLAGLEDYMTYLLVLPFNHIAGFTGAMTYFLTGCELDFIENVNPSKLAEGLQKFQPYYFAMVPKVYEIIEQKIRVQIRNRGKTAEFIVYSMMKISGGMRKYFGINIGRKMFKNIVSAAFGEHIFGIGTGASPCKSSTTKFFLDLGLEWANLYATTETDVPITATGIHDRYPVGTVGNVNRHRGIEVIINDPDSNGIGEVLVKTDLIMKGYFREPELTAAAFDENGYFKTGDYGYIDKAGYLYLTGRIKESILLPNGKKVSPTDIDTYYSKLSDEIKIASCGVGQPDGFDEIHLFIETRNHSRETIDKVRRQLLTQSHVAGSIYKISEIHEIDQIPLTSIGKVKRFILREHAEKTDPVQSVKELPDGRESVFDTIRRLIMSVTNESGTITPDSRLKEDLEMDSLEIFELCVALSDRYNISAESELHNNITVRELETFICQKELQNNNRTTAGINTKRYPIKKTKKMVKTLKRWIKFLSLPYKFHVSGVENVPQNENTIICANHASYLDSIWILSTLGTRIDLEKIAGLAAQERLEGFISRKLFSLLGEIPVDRAGNTTPALYRAKECLIEENYTMLIFPEGARSRDGTMLPLKNGAAKLAIDCNKRILPVYIGGSFEIFPRHKRIPHIFDWKHLRRYPLQIRFGTLVSPEGKTAEEITGEIREQIGAMKQEGTL